MEIISATEEDGKIKIEIKDENIPSLDSNDIKIEIKNFYDTQAVSKSYNETSKTHTIYLTGTPIYYLDSYEITKMEYKDNEGEEYSVELSVKIDYTTYKQISSVEEWAAEFCKNYSGYNYHKVDGDGKVDYLPNQNYEITGDINLEDIKTLNGENLSIPVNLEIGRLKGRIKNNNEVTKIYGNISNSIAFSAANSGIFKEVSRELKNIKFENIKITNSTGNYFGIISRCMAQTIENVKFNNITVQTNKSSYVGVIGHSTCTNISDIELSNINVKGASYIGGMIGYSYPGIFKNISANEINITSTGTYVGGFAGFSYNTTAYTQGMNNINFSNVNITKTGNGSDIGGLLGRNYIRNSKNIYLTNIKIDCSGSTNYVGGFSGQSGIAVSYIYIYGVNIKTNGTLRVGGITGYCGGLTEVYVEGKEGYNIINAPNASEVGGIVGYTWVGSTLNRGYTKNINITANNRVGGIVGRVINNYIRDSISESCNVVGNNYVGGIAGDSAPDTTTRIHGIDIYNSYTNSNVTANQNYAGGLLGYLDNSRMNNNTYVSRLYRNYVACSEITTNETDASKGSMIGYVTSPLYYLNNTTKYYYGNLMVTNIDESHPIGNIDSIYENITTVETVIDSETGQEITQEVQGKRQVQPEETMSRLYNSIFYQYTVENGEKVLAKSKLDNLKVQSTYKNTLLYSTVYVYTNIATKFPTLKSIPNKSITYSNNETHSFSQNGILLPKQSTMIMAGSPRRTSVIPLTTTAKKELPKYNIYVSDIDKINIEFDKKYEDAYFKYKTEDGKISDAITISKRTYTFEYNFNSSFSLIIGNGENEEEYIISPNNVSKKIGVQSGNYYYLEGSKLIENGTENSNFEFVNIFIDKALTTDGYIYDISMKTKENEKIEKLKLLEEAIPLSKLIYFENVIETYYNYSKIISEEETISEYQMFMKNGKIFILDGSLNIYADSIIIDAYNNKEYQTVLGLDGKLYDLKDEINYPENFANENIVQMTNNINKDENIILIMYDSGRVYAFNYITGSVIYDSQKENLNENSLIPSKAKSSNSNVEGLYNTDKVEYEEALNLEEKLRETPIETLDSSITGIVEGNEKLNIQDEGLTNSEANNKKEESEGEIITNSQFTNEANNSKETKNKTNNSYSQDNTYTTVYDAGTNKYLVYKTSDLLKNNKEDEKVVSETEKITSNPGLKAYYEIANGKQNTNNTNGIYFVVGSIIFIMIILGVMYKKKNY